MYLTAILATAHLGALGCVFALPLDWMVRGALSVPVGLGLLLHLPAVTPRTRIVTRLRWAQDGLWTIWDGTGRSRRVAAGRGLLVHPWMTILRFRCRGCWRRFRFVVIVPDSAAPDLRRRLNVRLRMEGGRV